MQEETVQETGSNSLGPDGAGADPSPAAPVPTRASAATATELIAASPDAVFEVLVDPTTYPVWLMGARQVPRVEPRWPAVGSSFGHRIGWGPLRIPGSTSVRRCEPNRELVLAAGMGPLGEASVRFELEAVADGTVVHFEELPARGLVRLAWTAARPVVAAALWGRNAVSLHSLSEVVQQRSTTDGSTSDDRD